MGAANSTQNSTQNKSLTKVIDFVATNYILTQNFTDMKDLANIDYCNNLVIMSADIIAKKLNEQDIKYLAQRIKDGVEINEMVDEKIIFLKKSDLESLDIKNSTTKRRVCIGIAKFYVRVAHLFAAIVTTINPIYTYKDKYGSTVKATLMNKQSIPKGAETSIKKFNICTQRLNALINNQDFDVQPTSNVTVKPKFCDMNYDRVRGRDKTLIEEPGIPELEKLYYDKYDDDNGGFKGMTENMRKNVYEKDVARFYTAFTGNKNMPSDAQGNPAIKKFSQIPLRDFHRSKGCASNGVYTKSYSGNLKDKLFGDYAEHIKTMMQTSEDNQNKLIGVIDDIFVISLNPTTGRKEIVINPALTEEKLDELVILARNTIIDLYIKCEDDFIKGLELFEAIVEKQIMDTSKEQIAVLEKTIQDSIADATEEPPSETTANETGPVQEGAVMKEKEEEDKPNKKSDEVPVDKPADKPAEVPVDKPAEVPADKPADVPEGIEMVEKPVPLIKKPTDSQEDLEAKAKAAEDRAKTAEEENKLLTAKVNNLEQEKTAEKIAEAVNRRVQPAFVPQNVLIDESTGKEVKPE